MHLHVIKIVTSINHSYIIYMESIDQWIRQEDEYIHDDFDVVL